MFPVDPAAAPALAEAALPLRLFPVPTPAPSSTPAVLPDTDASLPALISALLRRDTDPVDRRSKLLFATPGGRQAFAQVQARRATAEAPCLQGMDAASVLALRHDGLQPLKAQGQQPGTIEAASPAALRGGLA